MSVLVARKSHSKPGVRPGWGVPPSHTRRGRHIIWPLQKMHKKLGFPFPNDSTITRPRDSAGSCNRGEYDSGNGGKSHGTQGGESGGGGMGRAEG